MHMILTLLTAAAGGGLLWRLKVPVGALTGALIAVAVFHVLTGWGEFPPAGRVAVQAVTGAFIGLRITRADILQLRTLLIPALQLLGGIIALSLATGFLFWKAFGISLLTALYASFPGGITEITMAAMDAGADMTQVTILQLGRIFVSVLLLPQWIIRRCRREGSGAAGAEPRSAPARRSPAAFPLTALTAAAGGTLGYLSGMPAGAMLFAAVSAAALNCAAPKLAGLPVQIRPMAQCCAGAAIACSISRADLLGLPAIALPCLVAAALPLAINWLLGTWIYRSSGLDLATCLFGSVPAGISDMALVCLDMGGDAPKVAVLHMVRYIGLIAVMPGVIALLVSWLD